MGITKKIEEAKTRLKKAEQAKTVAETQLAEAKKQQAEIVAEMEKLGVTPETAASEIERLEASQTQDLETIDQLLPKL